MKNSISFLGLIAFIAIIGFSMTACDNGGSGNANIDTKSDDPRPKSPESMSAKTAMQYFIDEGITVGINMGNTLDAVNAWENPSKPVAIETEWGNPKANQTLFNGYKDMGFKIVRIPITWSGHIGEAPDYKVSEVRLQRVAEVVNYAKNAGLKVIINIHHDGNHNGLGGWLNINTVVKGNTEISVKYEKVWKQIAEYFKNYGDYLMFQGFNEIHDGTWKMAGTQEEYDVINDWNKRFTNAVRSTGGNNDKRYLLYYGYMTSFEIVSADSSKFVLPNDGANGNTKQIVGFHYYNPMDFGHDGKNHIWDTSFNKTHIETYFSGFKAKFFNNGIPVIIGENGPVRYRYNNGNTETAKNNRLLFIDYMFGKARENGIVPIYWEPGGEPAYFSESDDYGDFSLINRNTGKPNSMESRTVIERMISAIENATPPGGGSDPSIGEGTAAVFISWSPENDAASSITYTTPSGRHKITGTLTGSEGYANISATPDMTTLAKMKTMASFTFMVSGDGKQYDVMIPTTESLSAYNHYRYRFTAPASETKITVNVPANLAQADWGGEGIVSFIQNNVNSFQFQLSGTGTFDLTIWHLRIH
jgi:endoglucanase